MKTRCWMITHSLMVLGALGGCVSDEPDRPTLRPQPSDVQAESIFPAVELAKDTDVNGYLDTIDAIVYVWGDRYKQASIYLPGSFTITLTSKAGEPIAEWKFDEKQCSEAVRKLPPGPGYIFRLSLLDRGGDRIEAQSADLRIEFAPTKGRPIYAPATELRIGKTGA
jgi:hypothetical protein